ncbi:MAG: hypothetical protein PHU68_03730 [Paludibacter sp.]|nr:hypothetical protein [Paludibacter sp.]
MKQRNFILFLDKTLSGGIWRQLGVFVILIVLVLCFFWVFFQLFNIPLTRADEGDAFGPFWNLLYFFSDGGSQTSATESNRFFVYLISIAGSVLLGGVLISTLSNIFERRVEDAEKGLLRYKFVDHVVVIGYNESTTGLIKQLADDPRYAGSVFVLHTNIEAAKVRLLLSAGLSTGLNKRVVIYYGRRDSREEVELLSPPTARELYILNEADDPDSDSLNMDCMKWVALSCRRRSGDKLRCHVIFRNQTTVSAFYRADLSGEIREAVEFYPLVYHEIFARHVLVDNQVNDGEFVYPSLDRIPIDEHSGNYVHLIIFRMTDMGITMGMQAAHIAHYPNYQKRKTKITFVDSSAEKRMHQLSARYQSLFDVSESYFLRAGDSQEFIRNPTNPAYAYLGDFTDTRFYFVEGSAEMPEVRTLLEKWVADNDALVTIAVCNEHMHQSIADGMFLPRTVYEQNVPVLIYQKDSASVLQSLGNARSASNAQVLNPLSAVYPFGMVKNKFSMQNHSLLWAQRINFVYTYFFDKGKLPDELPGAAEWKQTWEACWHSLIIAKQWSNIYHANSIPTKLRSIGYSGEAIIEEDKVEILSQVEHNRWIMEELIMGYRPATQQEREAIHADPSLKKAFRNRFVHVDLCHYNDLLKDANGVDVREYDRILIRRIPMIISK